MDTIENMDTYIESSLKLEKSKKWQVDINNEDVCSHSKHWIIL